VYSTHCAPSSEVAELSCSPVAATTGATGSRSRDWPWAAVVLAADPRALRGDAATNFHAARAVGVEIIDVHAAEVWELLTSCDVLVDALLGIGQRGEPRGDVAFALALLRQAARNNVVAIDVPTGVCADTGAILAPPAAAALTVTFHGLRRAHCLPPSAALCGRVVVADIGIPGSWEADGASEVIDQDAARRVFRTLPSDAYKQTRGHVLVVAGSDRWPGAATLCALGAYGAGAGLVSVATTGLAASALLAQVPEAMWFPTTELEHVDLSRFTSFVIGPGCDPTDSAGWERIAREAGPRPVVIDASAIAWFTSATVRPHVAIATPHPGELATLVGKTSGEVLADLPAAAAGAARLLGAVVVAKTAGAWIVEGDRTSWVASQSAAIGVAGAGDVLAGVIGALASRHAAGDAARVGAWVHQRAGALAAGGDVFGVRASAIAASLRNALRDVNAR
jgi:hydroxyethylthiazole kinase-like uncharacterized protein yjeF